VSHPPGMVLQRRGARRTGRGPRHIFTGAELVDLSLQLQHDLVAVQTDVDLHVMVELAAPPAPTDRDREPLHVALVIDRSGSMHGGRLEAAKRSASYLGHQLTSADQLAVVAYDDEVSLLHPLQPVDATRIDGALAGLMTGGMTNLSGGWLKGVEELGRVADGVRRVLLLSDGHANQGIRDRSTLERMATEVAGGGVSTTTIGFGDGFDEHLMTAIADAGSGHGYFAETPDDAAGIFADEFADLATLVAQNVSVEVRPSGEVDVIEVLNAFPSTAVPGGVQVQLGDAFADRSVRLVLRLRVPAIASLGLATIGEVVVRWVAVGDEITQHTVTQPLVVNAVSADEAAQQLPNAAVTEEVVVLAAAVATEEARKLADGGDLDEAKKVLDRNLAELRKVSPDHPAAEELRASIDRLERTSEMLGAEAYGPADAKRMYYEQRRMQQNKRNRRP
jgi:Ca-activated chloride channel homolog